MCVKSITTAVRCRGFYFEKKEMPGSVIVNANLLAPLSGFKVKTAFGVCVWQHGAESDLLVGHRFENDDLWSFQAPVASVTL